MSLIVDTPKAPYYAVIFTSRRTDADEQGYAAMADKMVALAALQSGFIGIESARDSLGITVSYWSDIASIKKWKQHVDHQQAQENGRTCWYAEYRVRVAKVEREYGL